MNEMVERCVAALLKEAGMINNTKIQDDLTIRRFSSEGYAERYVRAVIKAMREPTEAMERAAMDAALDNGAWDVEAYQARIDAALKE